MSKVIITSQKLVDLADAVRTHNSISDKLKLPDIPGMVGVKERVIFKGEVITNYGLYEENHSWGWRVEYDDYAEDALDKWHSNGGIRIYRNGNMLFDSKEFLNYNADHSVYIDTTGGDALWDATIRLGSEIGQSEIDNEYMSQIIKGDTIEVYIKG